MKRIIQNIITIVLLTLLFQIVARGQNNEKCRILHEGIFTYGPGYDLIRVEIKDNQYTEYNKEGKCRLRTNMEWINDCTCNMTIKKVRKSDYSYKKGEVMNIRIVEVVGNNIGYIATVKEDSWPGIFTKEK